MKHSGWMIYGANGYTGELVIEEALAIGERPVLAGRNHTVIQKLAQKYGLEGRVFALGEENGNAVLDGIETVLHCAGPFVWTAQPMLDLCVKHGVHYLDITGEIDVFEALYQQDQKIKDAGIAAISGVGFDVVPTDCLAAQLKEEFPAAEELTLAFQAKNFRLSPGTTKTMIETGGDGGRVRKDSKITRVPVAWHACKIPFIWGEHLAVTIPWGDVSSAYRSTGIENIKVYMSVSEKQLRFMRISRWSGWLLKLKSVRRMLQNKVDRKVKGPDATMRLSGRVAVYGSVKTPDGKLHEKHLETPEGYRFTALAALRAVQKLRESPLRGAFTPSQAFGANFALEIDGVKQPNRALSST